MKSRVGPKRWLARTSIVLVLLDLLVLGSGKIVMADEVSDGQWYVSKLRLDAANKLSTGLGVLVAVIDSGVDSSHPVLRGGVLPGADFTDSAELSQGDGRIDDEGHGTAMAALVIGRGRVRGVAPLAMVLPVRVGGGGYRTNFAAGIQWAVDHGARIINISRAAPLADPREMYAIQYAVDHDVVVVAGVGNMPASSVQYPAKYPGVLAVGATTLQNKHAEISASGPEISLSAPGQGISSARLGHGYAVATGTSDSTALVSGVAALIRARYPTMSARNVINRLIMTAIDLGKPGRDDLFGYGLVDPVAALTRELPTVDDNATHSFEPPSKGQSPRDGGNHQALGVVFGAALLLALLAATGTIMVVTLVRRNSR